MAIHDGSLGLDDATLSALVDGELAPEESRRALERIAGDAQLQARWARYHAMRAACEGAVTRSALRPGFSDRVRDALADEPTVVAPHARWRRPWSLRRPASGLAVAASVALVAVGGVVAVQWQDGMPGAGTAVPGGGTAVVSERGSEVPAMGGTGGEGLEQASLVAAADGATLKGEHRMAIYLARHNEYAGAGDMPKLVPNSRLTSFNAAAR